MKLSIDFPFVHADVDRHGNERLYFRRRVGAPKIRLRSRPGTVEFAQEYEAAKLRGERKGVPPSEGRIERPAPQTFGWLCLKYVSSAEFLRLGTSTQQTRRRVLMSCISESIAPGSEKRFSEFPLEKVTVKALRVLRDRKAELPGAANDRVKVLRTMFSWALEHDCIESNPTVDLKRVRYASSGHHAWTTAEIDKFEARHPIGTKARLALALLMWTGIRRSDVVRVGKQHVKNGWLKLPLYKNSLRSPVTVELPVAPQLAQIISASPVGGLTFLVTEYGRPFTAAGFGQWFRDRCDEAGLSECSAHGLRKAGAVRAAENGATAHELMAMFGWLSLAEAQRYTRSADRRSLAKNAARLLSRENK
jgi:site-specific recombinase XerD